MKSKGIICVCIILMFTLIGCVSTKNRSVSATENEKSIVSLRIHDVKLEFKEVTNKSNIDQIMNLINSVKVISDTEPRVGIGCGVEIIYSDNKKEYIMFPGGNIMDRNGSFYEVDKDLLNDLKDTYNKI